MPQILPTALDENVEYEDFYESTLDQPLNLGDTDIYPVNLPMSDVGILVLGADTAEPEIIFFNEKGANYIRVPSATDGEGRGVFNTTPKSWDEGTKIGMYSIAAFFEAIVTGVAMRNGFLEQRHFSSDVNPNNWTGLGQSLTFSSTNGNHESVYTATGDLTSILSPGIKFQLPRVTNAGYQCTDLESSSSQYATRATGSVANMTFTDDFTLEAWIKLESYTSTVENIVTRFSGTQGWGMRINSSGQLEIFGSNSTSDLCTSYQSVPLGRWIHVAATLDMSTATAAASPMYIDGVSVPCFYTNGAATAVFQAGDLRVGNDHSTGYFDGKIADVRVWNTIRTQTQIRDNMYKRLTGSETNLVSYFKLNGDFNDSTANNNHLTAQGSATATNADSPFSSTEYAIITKVNYSGGTTTITVFTGQNVAPAETVTNAAYSSARAPYGFPAERSKWLIYIPYRADLSLTATTSWQNLGERLINVPIGSWRIKTNLAVYENRPAGAIDLKVTLSTTNNAEDDVLYTWYLGMNSLTDFNAQAIIERDVVNTIATPYYLNVRGPASVNFWWFSARGGTWITAECAYL